MRFDIQKYLEIAKAAETKYITTEYVKEELILPLRQEFRAAVLQIMVELVKSNHLTLTRVKLLETAEGVEKLISSDTDPLNLLLEEMAKDLRKEAATAA